MDQYAPTISISNLRQLSPSPLPVSLSVETHPYLLYVTLKYKSNDDFNNGQ